MKSPLSVVSNETNLGLSNEGLRNDYFGASTGKGRNDLFRCTALKNNIVKDRECGHLKRCASLNFVHSDQRCDAIASCNECAFKFGVGHLERANSQRHGNGASSEET